MFFSCLPNGCQPQQYVYLILMDVENHLFAPQDIKKQNSGETKCVICLHLESDIM